MNLPHECNDLPAVRAEIDRLDHEIIAAMGRRLEYVKSASRFKRDEAAIPAPERVAAMLPERRAWASAAGLDPDFVEKIFGQLIDWYINEQIRHYREKTRRSLPLDAAIDGSRLLEMLRAARERARASGRGVLVSLARPVAALDPIRAFDAAHECGDTMLWSKAGDDFALVGVGTAHLITTTEQDRFDQVASAWRQLLDDAVLDVGSTAGPLLAGGFSFDPARERTALWKGFGATAMTLPRLQLTWSGEAAHLTVNIIVGPDLDAAREVERIDGQWRAFVGRATQVSLDVKDDDEDFRVDEMQPARWTALVEDATAAIRAGQFQKVVLAREVRLTTAWPIAVARTLRRLRGAFPAACVFAVRRRGRCFLGATPERLVRLKDKRFEVMALAGTCRRSAVAWEDRQLAQQLLSSPKDRLEHALVVETLRTTLAAFSRSLDVPDQPCVLQLDNVQHLCTPLSGELAIEAGVLELVAALHPTPAVGGLPRATALDYLRRNEPLDRGWYAGPVGWLDARGDGEFAVALRCALVSGNEASLFAGCGIVGESDPERELEETRLKLRAMFGALEPKRRDGDEPVAGGSPIEPPVTSAERS